MLSRLNFVPQRKAIHSLKEMDLVKEMDLILVFQELGFFIVYFNKAFLPPLLGHLRARENMSDV